MTRLSPAESLALSAALDELAEVAAQWRASAAWESKQRVSAQGFNAKRTLTGIRHPPRIEEAPFPLVRRRSDPPAAPEHRGRLIRFPSRARAG